MVGWHHQLRQMAKDREAGRAAVHGVAVRGQSEGEVLTMTTGCRHQPKY